MTELPADWAALCAVVLLLGIRHGFDADHLATIDGLTRLGIRRRSAYARFCGTLFSLGHGAVVLAIAGTVGVLSTRWTPPGWLDAFGAWVSIGFLLAIGIVNGRAVLAADPGSVVALVGVKGRFVERLLPARSPLGVAGVGALFALSFDTVSQATLFALTAARFQGAGNALLLGALFVLGMLITDGLNGWWISRLIARADQVAAIASRIMSVSVSAVSLLVAAIGIGRALSPRFDAWNDGKELACGVAVTLLVVLGYALARGSARSGTQNP